MKKKILLIAVLFVAAVISYYYVDIAAAVMSELQYDERPIEAIKIDLDPQDKLGEIAAAALGSISKTKINGAFLEEYRYIAVDAEMLPKLSDRDRQYLIAYFKEYNPRTIVATKEDLRKLLLQNPINKSCNGGIFLSVNKVVELTNDKAVLEISYFVNKYDGIGYTCTLVYEEGKWQAKSTDSTYMP